MNQNTGSIPTNSYDTPIQPILKKGKESQDIGQGREYSGEVGDSPNPDKKTVTFENFDNYENEPTKKKPDPIPFWTENPNVLFQQQSILEFFPVDSMTYEQKLNAVSRTVILLTIISLIINPTIRILMVGAVTLGAVFIMYYFHEKERKKVAGKKLDKKGSVEGFEGAGLAYFTDNKIPVPTDLFTSPDSSNPFSNVLVTDYDYNPNKKPAPPAFNQTISSQILGQAKKLVNDANPDQPNLSDKLFKDLGEQLMFEQSLRPFHSNPGTTIPNDQGAFADFCYGSMISCKEGNKFACARNLTRYNNY
jgi:hypothetical protein